MKKQILFKSALSLVAAVAAGSAWATDVAKYGATFESAVSSTEPLNDFAYVLNTSITNGYSSNGAGWFGAEGDTSSIVAGNNGQVLKLNTEGNDLENRLASQVASDVTAAVAADGAYFKAKVKFVASDSLAAASTITPGEDGEDAKFAIYAYAHEDGSATNLVVYHGYVDGNGDPQYVNEEFTSAPIDTEAFTEICVRMFQEEETGNNAWCFTVSVDGGQPLESTAGEAEFSDSTWMRTLCDLNGAGATSISKIVFKGTGEVDDIAVGTVEASAGYSASITLPTGCTLTGVTVDGDSVTPATTIEGLADGAVVAFTYTNADGVAKTATVTINGADRTATTEAYTWADYLGEAVNGAYEIDNLAELKLFQKGIATTTNELKLATAGETFKLTADIALDAAWPGIGVQNGKDIYSTADFNAAAFQGTFDGQNHTISGFQMQGGGLDYCGFFNSTYGATIQNLKIQYAGSLFAVDSASSTEECGATFVGVAKESTLQKLTSLAGTVSCGKGFGGVAGFVTGGTTVEYCTNNVNVTSLAGNKAGGVVMITQGGSGTATIRNCVNNGTTTGNAKQKGGIIGYLGTDGSVVIENCINNADSEPTFFSFNKGTVTVNGVNKAPDSAVPCKNTSGAVIAVSGLKFATVDNGVATFVADNALAAGNIYKVMGPSATATYEFAAAGSISFDTNLIQNVTFAITAGEGLTLGEPTTENGVVTYTAAAAQSGWVPDSSTVSNETAAVAYPALAESALAGANAGELTDWAKDNNIAFADVTAAPGDYVDAFLLNCAVADVDDEKDDFLANITFDANGDPVVTGPEGKTYNGTIKVLGKEALSDADWTDLTNEADTSSYKFFKLDLGF